MKHLKTLAISLVAIAFFIALATFASMINSPSDTWSATGGIASLAIMGVGALILRALGVWE
ncbi:hypothetical protein M2149_000821 [Lachnospiraceae bacterium PFB1-21]